MGQKIRPNSLRLGIIKPWNARWFPRKNFAAHLEEDELIRRTIHEKLKLAGIARIEFERGVGDSYRIFIKAAKPGLIIGRGGKGIEEITKFTESRLAALFRERGVKHPKVSLSINIEELKRTEISAQYAAQNIAWDLEKRLPARRVIKRHLEQIMQNREVKGAKIKLSGRVDGNEIARRETLAKGRLPLQTLRADIDYGEATALCAYGTVGVKVWIYTGDVFSKEKSQAAKLK